MEMEMEMEMEMFFQWRNCYSFVPQAGRREVISVNDGLGNADAGFKYMLINYVVPCASCYWVTILNQDHVLSLTLTECFQYLNITI